MECVIEKVVEAKIEVGVKKEKSYEELVDELKQSRLNKAKEEKVKPSFVYNNEMMEEIIKMKPKNEEELIAIRGFGPVKIEKYGQDIIDIIKL